MMVIELKDGRKVYTPWTTIAEAAAFCRMDRSTFVRKASRTNLEFAGDKKNKRYHEDTLSEWLEQLAKGSENE